MHRSIASVRTLAICCLLFAHTTFATTQDPVAEIVVIEGGIQVESTQTVDGQPLKLRAAKGKEGNDKTNSTMALSMITPFFFLTKGGDATISAGSAVTVYTAENVFASTAQHLLPSSRRRRLRHQRDQENQIHRTGQNQGAGRRCGYSNTLSVSDHAVRWLIWHDNLSEVLARR